MAYSTVLTYVLWLTLGIFGAHHFYLGRDRHAFVWFWTIGGGLGVGWLVEAWRLPTYISTANRDANPNNGDDGDDRNRWPSLNMKRFLGEMIFATVLATIAVGPIPEEVVERFYWIPAVICPASIAIGIHTVANIGLERCDLVVCMISAYSLVPFFLWSSLSNAISSVSFFAALAINYEIGTGGGGDHGSIVKFWRSRGKHYRRERPVKRPFCKRVAVLGSCSVVIGLLVFTSLWFNTYVTTEYGERIKLSVAVQNFFASVAWKDFRQTLYILWRYLLENGTEGFSFRFNDAIDLDGEQHAYQVLGVARTATEKEVNDRYKELVKKYHPDKFKAKDEEERKMNEQRFINIQQAYEKLSAIKGKRMRKNQRMRKSEL